MKRWIALILVFVMVLGMAGCGGSKRPVSDVTVEVFEKSFSRLIDDIKFKETETESGITISANGKQQYAPFDTFFNYTYSGEADKKGNLYSVILTVDEIGEKFTKDLSYSQFTKDMSDLMNVPPVGRIPVDFFLMYSVTVFTILSSLDNESGSKVFSYVLDSMKSSQSINGWNYTISFDTNNEKATLTAEYIG